LRAILTDGFHFIYITMSNALEVKKSILEIGKAKFSFNDNIKNYTFNSKPPRAIPIDYYSQLHKKFKDLLLTQLKENCTKELLDTYIEYTKTEIKKVKNESDNLRVSYVFIKSKGEISDEAEGTYTDISMILSTQYSVLLKIQSKLEEELEFVGFKTSIDYQTESKTTNLDPSNIPFSNSGKATFKLSKKESLMLLYILEQNKLIEFEDDNQRRKFIENNFNFTEVRNNNNEGKPLPMIGINSEISKFRSLDRDELKSNNKTLNSLLERLNNTIYEFKFKK